MLTKEVIVIEKYIGFEQKLAFHAAPSLLGIKAANMLSVKRKELDLNENIKRFNEKTAEKGLKIEILCECEEKALLLVYNRRLMENRFSDCKIREFLIKYGYPAEYSLDECIKRLSQRIEGCGNFPHEVGVFLDYPLEDVEGFIENNGANYKLCGCHKVYGDEVKAARTFSNYAKCRSFLCNKLNTGFDIYQALKIS